MIAGTETFTIVASTMIIATPRLSMASPSQRPLPDSAIEAGAAGRSLVMRGPSPSVAVIGRAAPPERGRPYRTARRVADGRPPPQVEMARSHEPGNVTSASPLTPVRSICTVRSPSNLRGSKAPLKPPR